MSSSMGIGRGSSLEESNSWRACSRFPWMHSWDIRELRLVESTMGSVLRVAEVCW